MHSAEDLERDLVNAGLKHSDTVLIHSSYSAVGEVSGGIDTVLEVLEGYFGGEGLLVMPAMTFSLIHPWDPDSERCQRCPIPEKYCFARGLSIRDVRRFRYDMPCCVGALCNRFLKRPGVFRSLSLTSSVAALGRDAREFTSGHERCESGCARGSPWEKLIDREAKILLIGCPVTRMTFLHGVAEWARPAEYLSPPFPMPVEVYDATGRQVNSCEIRPVSGFTRCFAAVERPLRDGGALVDWRFGDAPSLLADCRRTFNVVAAILRDQPELFGRPRTDH